MKAHIVQGQVLIGEKTVARGFGEADPVLPPEAKGQYLLIQRWLRLHKINIVQLLLERGEAKVQTVVQLLSPLDCTCGVNVWSHRPPPGGCVVESVCIWGVSIGGSLWVSP